MSTPILALTLHPEWAWAITHLGKRVENRSERFARQIIRRVGDGWLAIHAGVKYPADFSGVCGMANATGMVAEFKCSDPLGLDPTWRFDDLWIRDRDLTRGAIVALVKLDGGFYPHSSAPWKVTESAALVLADVLVLDEPIRCKGRQGLWTPDPDVQERLRAAVEVDHATS